LVVGCWGADEYALTDHVGDLRGEQGTFFYSGGVVGGSYFYCTQGNPSDLNLDSERVIRGDFTVDVVPGLCGGVARDIGKIMLSFANALPGNEYRLQLEALLVRELANVADPCFKVCPPR